MTDVDRVACWIMGGWVLILVSTGCAEASWLTAFRDCLFWCVIAPVLID